MASIRSDSSALFNGNISSMGVNITKLSNPMLYNYQYDQLNRLVKMDAWHKTGSAWNNIERLDDFQERISYDANGNILKYKRNGNTLDNKPLGMDSLNYKYAMGTNRLDHVTDSVAAGNYTEDIDSQMAGNYKYDSIGNLTSDNAEGITSIAWTVYDKINHITKSNGTNIYYTYDASGNRISKAVVTGTSADTTWYVRDAQGNTVSVYRRGIDSVNDGRLTQTELHLFGSSRLGMLRTKLDVASLSEDNDTTMPLLGKGYGYDFVRGKKLFELSNHLANVLVTVSDKKFGFSVNDSTVDYYETDVENAQDYYPFGMTMVGRSYNAGGYRYGFNGKENDDKVKGAGNQVDYGKRVYDTRLGKFLSVDPLTKDYPWYAPYQFAGNTPIWAIDLEGLEEYFTTDGTYLGKTGPKQEVYTADRLDLQVVDCGDGTTGIEKIAINAVKLNTDNVKLKKMAATVYAESSIGYGIKSKEEMYGIASVHMRNKIAFGANATLAKKFLKTDDFKRNETAMQLAVAAVINALTGGTDYSNGARQWDGAEQASSDGDQFSDGKFLYKMNVMGWTMSDDLYASWKKNITTKFGKNAFKAPQEKYAVDNYKGYKNKDRIRLQATAQYALTMFWKEVNLKKPEEEKKKDEATTTQPASNKSN